MIARPAPVDESQCNEWLPSSAFAPEVKSGDRSLGCAGVKTKVGDGLGKAMSWTCAAAEVAFSKP